jgi:hypothetical protein
MQTKPGAPRGDLPKQALGRRRMLLIVLGSTALGVMAAALLAGGRGGSQGSAGAALFGADTEASAGEGRVGEAPGVRRPRHSTSASGGRAHATTGGGVAPANPDPAAYRVLMATKSRPRDLYNAEQRHPTWAPAMEAKLERRFGPELAARWPGLKLEQIECRTSSCQVVVSLTEELVATADARHRSDPVRVPEGVMSQISTETGPFATLTNRLPDRGQPLRETYVFVFGDEDIDPLDYDIWVARELAQVRRLHARPDLPELVKQLQKANP